MSTQEEVKEYLTLFYYGLKPSWALAVVATFLFAVITLVLLAILILKRCWFLFPLICGALFEVVGYAFRVKGLREDFPRPGSYIIYSTLIILAPAFIAASLYQLLAQIVVGNGRAGMSSWKFKLAFGLGFGALDILGYALQAAGSSKLKYGPFPPSADSPGNIAPLLPLLSSTRTHILAGAAIALTTLLLFTGLVLYYLYTFHLLRRTALSTSTAGFRILGFCLALLLVRSSYRVIAYSRGLVDPFNTDPATAPLRMRPLFLEGWAFAFDALVVFVLLLAAAAWWPAGEGQVGLGERLGGAAGRGRSRGRLEGVFA